MKIQKYIRLNDIPGIERFSNNLPVFATQEYVDFLKEVENKSTIWFHGFVSPEIQFIIPFSVSKKFIIKIGMFLTASICVDENVDNEPEKDFLNSITSVIKQEKLCDWIQQPPNWALFRVKPEDSIFCEFGTYRINLSLNNRDELFKNVDYHHKRLINKSIKSNVIIKSGPEFFEDCLKVFIEATAGGNQTLPTKNEIEEFLGFLPNNIDIYVSYNKSIAKSSVICFSNKFCRYAVYIGAISAISFGENHLLHWEAIKDAKQNGIKYFDFIGARINPVPGSKQEGIQKFKKYFGGEFIEGYLWKMPINKFKYHLYNFLVRFKYLIELRKYEGDIIDQEIRRK